MPLLRRPAGGPWLAALALTAFALQTDDFVIAGVLPSIAHGLSVSQAAAGQLVTVFSVSCAVVAPIAGAGTAARSPRTVLTCGMLLFCAANIAVPLVPSYAGLLALRVVAALAAALALPAVFSVTAALSPPDRRGRHLATVTAGLTGAVVAGVPLGTWIGAAAGWRATFLTGGLLGAAALILLRTALPDVPPPPPTGLRERLRPAAAPAVLLALLATSFTVLGNMIVQTYLAPLLHGMAGVTPSGLGLLLTLTGLAGIAGTRLGGTLADRIRPRRSFVLAATGFAAAMAGLAICWTARPVPAAVALPFLLVWSAAAWAVPPIVQSRVLSLTGPATAPQALALSSSAVYLGASLGAGLGGWTIRGLGLGALPVIAAACAPAGASLFGLTGRTAPADRHRSEEEERTHA